MGNRPDFSNTEPAVSIGPFPQWGDMKKIVAMDPFGHLAPWLFDNIIQAENGKLGFRRKYGAAGIDGLLVEIRPTIAITRAHMKVGGL